MTASGADMAENQKRGRTGIPTFPSIRTTSFLTNRVEPKSLDGLLNVEIIGTGLRIDFEPEREARSVTSRWLRADG